MRYRRTGFVAFVLALLMSLPAVAQDAERRVLTSTDADYFGFDLRTEKDVSQAQCEALCLDDADCNAFTYTTRHRWCFLKSDHAVLKPFPGAIAGRLVEAADAPDIGPAPAAGFVPEPIDTEARRAAAAIATGAADETRGLIGLSAAARTLLEQGDARSAQASFSAALRLEPGDAALWTGLARANLGIDPGQGETAYGLAQAASAAALNGYRHSRTAGARAAALAVLAEALDRRNLFRPAIEAYKASLELAPSGAVRAAYEDLRERKGFRVTNHSVDADSTSPRICVQFSEDLVRSGIDYGAFVTVDGAPAAAVEAQNRQVCAEGLEHGRSYRVSLRQGLPSAIGEALESPVTLNVYVRDRAPAVRFSGDSFVLPASGRHGIPLVSVNAERARVEVYRVGERALSQLLAGGLFLSQLAGHEASRIGDDIGAPVWQGSIDLGTEPNREVTTSFPVDSALPDRKPGIYVMTAMPEDDRRDSWEARATQWFVISDIGLASFTGEDGLSLFVRSLDTARPLAGVEVQLIARNNEILGTGTSDAAGRVPFAAGLVRGTGGMAPAAVLARTAAGDFVLLDLGRAGFDLSDRGVAGRAAPGPVDVFSWTERGIYRPGETVHAAALVRDASANAIAGLPVTFIVRRPDGVEDRRLVSTEDALGGHAVAYGLEANAMRGTWTVLLHDDVKADPLAEMRFLVEDFVPDRLEFDLAAEPAEIAAGVPATVSVDGRFLYGAPAAGLALEGGVRVETVRTWARHPGYLFGLAEEDAEAVSLTLDDLPALDGAGKAAFPAVLDEVPATTRPVTATVSVRLREPGGRAVERQVVLPVRPEATMIGVRPEFADGQVAENATAGFRVIAVAPDGGRADLAGLRWTLIRIERNYQWYRSGSDWNYEPVDITREVLDGIVAASATGEARIAVPVGWGRYRLEVAATAPGQAATSVEFEAGWVVETASLDTPDGLEMALDKARYRPGDTARLTVSARHAGEVLVTAGAGRLLAVQAQSVPAGDSAIAIPVGADWGAGAYVTATLYRPGNAAENRLPARAIGVKWLEIDPSGRTLAVSLAAPQRTAPRGPLDVPVSVSGLAAGEPAYVAVAAVDAGILSLTRHQAPDPAAWYFGQRRMGLEIRDLYGRLIDGSPGAAGAIRSGGDGPGLSADGSPPTEALVAQFTGPVALDAEGRATVGFDLPQFNGTVRLMAVAWSAAGVGSAQRDVVVRDPVVVLASAPKVLAPGDRTRLMLDIANTDGPAGGYEIDVMADGGLVAGPAGGAIRIDLAAGERTSIAVPLMADAAGAGSIAIRLSHASGIDIAQTLSVPVRSDVVPATTRRTAGIAAGGSFTLDERVLDGYRRDGASVTLGVSRSAGIDVASVLLALDRYPYGCTEQTTSRALPLLYLSDLPGAGGDGDGTLRERIQQAVYRVLANQSSSGSFGLWNPGYGDIWLDAYVTDFLTRAREKGFAVREEAMLAALENLQNSLAYEQDVKGNGSAIAYALYVLARNRRAAIGDLRYHADTQLGDFASPMARAQIAASLALYGDANRAETAFRSATGLIRTAALSPARGDYGSSLRDAAAVLALAAETRPLTGAVPALVGLVSEMAARGRHFSTQENAWMLLAARALNQTDAALRLAVDGADHAGGYRLTLPGEDLTGAPVTIANRGDEPAVATVTVMAAPAAAPPAGGNGFTIERSYYTLDGEPADAARVSQNTRLVAVLKIVQHNDWMARVAVSDLLPGGFEIDSPKLVGSADLKNFEWLGETSAAHSEFRADRFIAAFDIQQGGTREHVAAYVVRAVTPGDYALPAAVVEDMYRPEYTARTGAGRLTVTPAAP